MLEEVLAHLHNWFEIGTLRGSFHVSGGSIDLPGAMPGQYFRVVGSVFNDGLHQYPASDMVDEEFNGEIRLLAVPKAVQDLALEIEEWIASNPSTAYTSESFGGYTYSRASDVDGSPMDWRGVFRSRLNRWRKLA